MEVSILKIQFHSNSLFIILIVDENGNTFPTSLLREVMRDAYDEERKKQLVMRSHSHQQMIEGLRKRRDVCEKTIKVIEETNFKLNECT